MNYFKSFSACLVALTLTGTAWAEIYETKDAEGNPEFTNSPPTEDAKVVNLPETNLIEPPPQMPEEAAAPAERPQVTENNNNININEDGGGGGYNDEEFDDAYARERRRHAIDEATPLDPDARAEGLHEEMPIDSAAPHEVLDGEVPRTVGDFDEPQDVVDRRPREEVPGTGEDFGEPGGIEHRVVHPRR